MHAGIKHPARHYIYFLLSRRIYDTQAIIRELSELGIAAPEEQGELEAFVSELAAVRKKMRVPPRFEPTAADPNDATFAFLLQWGITDAWRNSVFVGAALDLLWSAPARLTLELLLLSPMSFQGIAERLKERHDLPAHAMNAGVVRSYKHYFWDHSAMNLAEWRTFLTRHHSSSSYEFLAALQAPRSSAGLAFVLSVVDKDPRLLSAEARYEMASSAGFRQFMQHSFGERSSRDTYAALAALNIMKIADGELEKYRGADTNLIADLQRIVPAYDRSKLPSISDSYIRTGLPITTTGVEVHDEQP